MSGFALPAQGVEWIVDAYGCSPERLREVATLEQLFDRIVGELSLHPVGEPRFHVFPSPGGVTGLLMLSESHLACHTFPERGLCAINLYCCRPRAEWPWQERLAEVLGAGRVDVRVLARPLVVEEMDR